MGKQKIIKSRWVLITRLFLLLAIFIAIITTIREYQSFIQSVNFFNDTSYNNRISEIQNEVDNRIEEIDAVKEQINQDFRSQLKETVTHIDFFAQQVVNNADPLLSLEDKRALYIDTIYTYDLQEDDYLFFAMDLDGMSYLSGLTKDLEGTDITYLQDSITGDYFVLDMIDIIESSPTNDGYISYHWIKEVGGEHLLKTSYLLYNEEVELFIGTGIYEEDYILSTQEELIERLSSYYNSDNDYIYIFRNNGEIMYHPLEDFDQEALLEIKTTAGESFHQYVINTLETNESIIFDYEYKFTGEDQIKTAYVRRIDDWDMYIGKSFVFDDLKLEQNEYFESMLNSFIIYGILTLGGLLTLILVIKKLININFKDVQEEFAYQNQMIKETSYRDQLTGIYNRKYFDTYIDNNFTKATDVAVLMIDANGLKLINDAYGHKSGDELLVELVNIIKEIFINGTFFRWGGDEFVIIIKEIEEKLLKDTIDAFYKKCKNTKIKTFVISASVGYVLGNTETNDLYSLINLSEANMYKNKLSESLSTKRQIIDNILDTLYNTYSFEQRHAENVKDYSLMIGYALDLDKEEINRLRLGALLHDAGKIGVPDKILQNPNPLSKLDIEEIRKHPEKGFRILSAYPELSEFGNYALTHHEWYDGTGYPRGLKGDEIPFFSRIISIADAFDAMTSKRVYHQTLSKEEAITELVEGKGTQFDPDLVDLFIKALKKDG